MVAQTNDCKKDHKVLSGLKKNMKSAASEFTFQVQETFIKQSALIQKSSDE